MSEKKAEKKTRDTSAKRKKILEAAISVFIENGYDTTSMDKIAEVANVSKITVYHHFQSKENLFQEIVSDFLKQSDERKPISYTSNTSLEDQLRAFALAELYRVKEPLPRGLSKLLTSVYLFKPDFVKATMSGHVFFENFTNWLTQAKEDGRMDFPSAQLAAQMFYGLMEGCLTWNILLTDGAFLKNVDPILDEIIRIFLLSYGCEKT